MPYLLHGAFGCGYDAAADSDDRGTNHSLLYPTWSLSRRFTCLPHSDLDLCHVFGHDEYTLLDLRILSMCSFVFHRPSCFGLLVLNICSIVFGQDSDSIQFVESLCCLERPRLLHKHLPSLFDSSTLDTRVVMLVMTGMKTELSKEVRT